MLTERVTIHVTPETKAKLLARAERLNDGNVGATVRQALREQERTEKEA